MGSLFSEASPSGQSVWQNEGFVALLQTGFALPFLSVPYPDERSLLNFKQHNTEPLKERPEAMTLFVYDMRSKHRV